MEELKLNYLSCQAFLIFLPVYLGKYGVNFLHSADLPVFQPHFNPAVMRGGARQNLRHYAADKLSCALVFFEHNFHFRTDFYIFPPLPVRSPEFVEGRRRVLPVHGFTTRELAELLL